MTIEIVLFQALEDVRALGLPSGISSSGKQFEDYMVKQLFQRLQQATLRIFPPRYTLREPTHSGVAHQFDIVIADTELVAIECKFRGKAEIDEMFAFMGKRIDYLKPPRGIFVTTAETINNEIFFYAIAHRILIVCLSLPPVEYMIHKVKPDTDLAYRLASLQARLQDRNPPSGLLVEWQNDYRRFCQEGYR